MALTVNVAHPNYNDYKKRKEDYVRAMYGIAQDPQSHRPRLVAAVQAMEYEEGSFGLDLVPLIMRDITLIDATHSDPVMYGQLRAYVFWLQTPQDQVCIKTPQGTTYHYKRDLNWAFGDFLAKHLVKNIPLPQEN